MTQVFWGVAMKAIFVGYDILDFVVRGHHFRKLLTAGDKFDVILVEAVQVDALYGLGKHFNAPLIAVSFNGPTMFTSDLVAEPTIPLISPNPKGLERTSFFDRLVDCFGIWIDMFLYTGYHLPYQEAMMRTIFPKLSGSTLNDIRQDVVMVLQNSHFLFGRPRPMPPNLIQIGGIHIEANNETKTLKPELRQFLDGATKGVIYISLGAYASQDSEDRRTVFSAFYDHAKVRLLIISPTEVKVPSHRPSDVLVLPNCPQEAVLAHPNVKMFMTHGGLLSIYEAVYYAKPIIGLVYMFDQMLNTQIVVDREIGFRFTFEGIKVETVMSAVQQIFTDPRFDLFIIRRCSVHRTFNSFKWLRS